MTVNVATITSGPYTGNGVTTSFSYTFRADTKNDLIVYETDTSGVVTQLTVDVDYTVNNIGVDSGGTITRIAGALPSGYTWYIRSDYDDKQDVDFVSQGAFYPDIHEQAIDRRTFLSLQQADLINRSVKLRDSYSGSVNLTLPDPEVDKGLYWNATGDGLVNGLTANEIQTSLSASQAAQVAAQAAQVAAEAAQAGAELALDTFDDRYLGEKPSDPTVDNDGNPLLTGAEYWNTTSSVRKIWTGTAWIESGASTASGIINVPAGNITATDVQAAINELSVALDMLAIERPTKTSTNVINVNGTDLTVPSPVAGTDYYFSLTTITTTKQPDTIGGFHYSLTPVGETPTGNKTTADITAIAGINEYSIWTNWFRPTCDPEGMVHINGRWYDIYLLNSEHIINGSSKAGATIAGGALSQGRQYPKIPLAFGGDGSTNYGKLTWLQAAEIAASHGKSLISYAEFPSIAYGVTEQTDASALDGGLANIEHYPTLTSKFGVEQATGTQWIWGADVGGNRSENSTAWTWRTGLTDNRGDIYALHNNHVTAVLLGGNRDAGVSAGSRASSWFNYVWYSNWYTGVRLACDHMLIK